MAVVDAVRRSLHARAGKRGGNRCHDRSEHDTAARLQLGSADHALWHHAERVAVSPSSPSLLPAPLKRHCLQVDCVGLHTGVCLQECRERHPAGERVYRYRRRRHGRTVRACPTCASTRTACEPDPTPAAVPRRAKAYKKKKRRFVTDRPSMRSQHPLRGCTCAQCVAVAVEGEAARFLSVDWIPALFCGNVSPKCTHHLFVAVLSYLKPYE